MVLERENAAERPERRVESVEVGSKTGGNGWIELLYRNVQQFRGGLVFKAHRPDVSLNSRLENGTKGLAWYLSVKTRQSDQKVALNRQARHSRLYVEQL